MANSKDYAQPESANNLKRSSSERRPEDFTNTAFFILAPDNPVRAPMIKLSLNPYFNNFILLMIAVNCVFLSIGDPVASCCHSLDQATYTVTTNLSAIPELKAAGKDPVYQINSYKYDHDGTGKGSGSERCGDNGEMGNLFIDGLPWPWNVPEGAADEFPGDGIPTGAPSEKEWQKCCIDVCDTYVAYDFFGGTWTPLTEVDSAGAVATCPNTTCVGGGCVSEDAERRSDFMCASQGTKDLKILMETVLNTIFTVEMVVKLLALGGDYWKSGFNFLDGSIVILGWLTVIGIMPNISGLRAVRAIKPLRSLNAIPSLKLVIDGLVNSIAGLVWVVALAVVLFTLFGVSGMMLFGGTVNGRCHYLVPDASSYTGDYLASGAESLFFGAGWCANGTQCRDPTDPAETRGFRAGPVAKNLWFNRFSIDEGNGAPCAMPCHYLYKEGSEARLKPGEGDYPNPIDWTSGGLRGDGWGRFTPGCIETGMGMVTYGGFEDTNLTEDEARDANAPGLGGFGMFSPGSRVNRCSENPASVANPFYKLNGAACPTAITADFTEGTLKEMWPELAPTAATSNFNRAKSLAEMVKKWYGTNQFSVPVDCEARFIEMPTFCLDTGNSQLGDGYAGFDNIVVAVGTLFTSLTLEGWVDIMYGSNAAFGLDLMTFIYWLLVVFMMAFYMMELCLAVIGDNYDEAVEAAEAEEAAMLAELAAQGVVADDSADVKDEGVGFMGLPVTTAETAVVKPLFDIVTLPAFNNFITFCILLNTLTLSMDHYNYDLFSSDPNGLLGFLWGINVFFVVVFFVEMVMKLLALGVKGYASDLFNLFDSILVIMSTLEFVMEFAAAEGGLPPGLSVLRAFRLFRVLKLAKGDSDFQKKLRTILSVIADGVASCSSAALLLGVILLIFVLIGMSVFAGNWRGEFYGGDPPGTNYDTFWWAMVACFQVLTGENWNEVMYAGLGACNGDEFGFDGEGTYHYYNLTCGTGVVLYFVLLNLIGNYMVLNLFLAILMAGFDAEDEDGEEFLEGSNPFRESDEGGAAPAAPAGASSAKVVPAGAPDAEGGGGAAADPDGKVPLTGTLPIAKACYNIAFNPMFENFILFCILLGTFNLMFEPPGAAVCYQPSVLFPGIVKGDPAAAKLSLAEGAAIPWEQLNRGTRLTYDGVNQLWVFNNTAAAQGSIYEDPTPMPGLSHYVGCSAMGDYQSFVSVLFNIFFIVEMILKLVALNPGPYFADTWNWLDFVVVAVGIVDMSGVADGLSWLKGLRAARALKPLRTVKRIPSLALVVRALFKALAESFATVLVLTIFLLIFGVSGVMFFGGKMNLCSNPDAATSSGLTGPVPYPDSTTMWDCVGYNTSLEEMKPTRMVVSYGGYPGSLLDTLDTPWPGPSNTTFSYEGSSGVMWPREGKLEAYANHGGSAKCTAEMCIEQHELGARACEHLVDEKCECRCFTPTGDTCELLPNATLTQMCYESGGRGLPLAMPVQWQSLPINFNDVFQAIGVVLEVASGEMWPDIMYTTQDAFGYNLPMRAAPHFQGRTAALWFIAVTFVIAFMMMQVFIGQVISVYEELKAASDGDGLITDSQKAYRLAIMDGLKHKAARKRYPRGCKKDSPPADALTQKCFDVATSAVFENFIMACILINALVMCIAYDTQPGVYTSVLGNINLLLLIVFTVEALVKLLALGPTNRDGNDSGYFDTSWSQEPLGNRFDFILVVLGWVGDAIDMPIFSLFRILRVLRVLRAVKSLPKLMLLVTTFFVAIPAIFNVFLVMMLFLLIFGIVFMSLFGTVKMMPGSDLGETALINPDANFLHFWPAFVTCFRMVTGESFNGIMHDANLKEPYCDPSAHGVGNCGVPFLPVFLLFNIFFILTSYILLSLILGTIIDNYGEVKSASDRAVNDSHFEEFQNAWKVFDEDGDEMIPESDLIEVIKMVNHPLGIKNAPAGSFDADATERKRANKLIQQLNIRIIDGQVNYNETLKELITFGMPDASLPPEMQADIEARADKKLKASKGLKRLNTASDGEFAARYNVSQSKGISLVQSAMNGYIYRRKMEAVASAMENELAANNAEPVSGQTQLPPLQQ